MKGIALGLRDSAKDAYDIHSIIGHCADGPDAVASLVRPHLHEPAMAEELGVTQHRFRSINAEGPVAVGEFLSEGSIEMRERIQANSYIEVGEFIQSLRE